MTISAQKLVKYLHKIQFPVNIYAEKSEEVVYFAQSRSDLEYLISEAAITGVGNWARIKRFRMNPKVSPAVKELMNRNKMLRDARLPVAEDNSTVVRVSRTFTHHAGRCTAYGRGMGAPLNSHCL